MSFEEGEIQGLRKGELQGFQKGEDYIIRRLLELGVDKDLIEKAKNTASVPIIANGEGIGCIIIGDKEKENKISTSDFEILSFACETLASRY